MENQKIHIRLRLIVIKNAKVLVQYRQKADFYHYIGGHLDCGETVLEGCIRETEEECDGANFEFKKILYIRDFFDPTKNGEQSLELFILGAIDKFEQLEHYFDPQHPNHDVWCTWLDLNTLPDNLLPHALSKKLLADYQSGFLNAGEYLGTMDK